VGCWARGRTERERSEWAEELAGSGVRHKRKPNLDNANKFSFIKTLGLLDKL
jgi:hypothetical protein